MNSAKILAIVAALIGVPGQAQTMESTSGPRVPTLAFKLLIRSTQPFFAPGTPLKVEVACVSVPEIASPEWQERWSSACSNPKLEVKEARLGGFWGGVGLLAWLQNRLHLCLPAAGESYAAPSHMRYTKPKWQSVGVPATGISGLRGMVQINAQVSLTDGEKQLDQEFAQVVTAIVSGAEDDMEAGLSSNVQRDAAVQLGNSERSKQLANELLESPTRGAVAIAVRLFDNTERTRPLWTVIENSPQQQAALDLMLVRLKDPDLLPDYDLLVHLTGMKARLDKPLEFNAEDKQPYTEYHPELEVASVAYFRELLSLLVDSTHDPRSARAAAIIDIATSLAEGDRCPLGTYGLGSTEAATIKSKLSGN